MAQGAAYRGELAENRGDCAAADAAYNRIRQENPGSSAREALEALERAMETWKEADPAYAQAREARKLLAEVGGVARGCGRRGLRHYNTIS